MTSVSTSTSSAGATMAPAAGRPWRGHLGRMTGERRSSGRAPAPQTLPRGCRAGRASSARSSKGCTTPRSPGRSRGPCRDGDGGRTPCGPGFARPRGSPRDVGSARPGVDGCRSGPTRAAPPPRPAARIDAGSSERGLSSVTTTRSATSAAAPMARRLPRSRSPPAPRRRRAARGARAQRGEGGADRLGGVGVVHDAPRIVRRAGDRLHPAGDVRSVSHGDRRPRRRHTRAGRAHRRPSRC
jgi:hypothetical protein